MDIIDIINNLEVIEQEYDALFEKGMDAISFDNKRLSECMKEQLPLMAEWEVMSKRIDYLYNDCEMIVEESYGEAIATAIRSEKYREVSLTEAKEAAKCDKKYKTARRTLNRVRALRDECRGILETIHSRKYIINNIVSAQVAGVDSILL